MDEPALSKELVDQWSDRRWRLNHLYYIQDKHGSVVLFQMNEAQEKLLDELHYLNIILKARQMGFSTFILILALDCCIFNDHFAAGLVADTLDNAKGLLKRIKFAYERMPQEIRGVVPIKTDNATEIEFGNGSGVEVGVSLRSGTKNFCISPNTERSAPRRLRRRRKSNPARLTRWRRGNWPSSKAQQRAGPATSTTRRSLPRLKRSHSAASGIWITSSISSHGGRTRRIGFLRRR
jgi:hypothetical protein